MKYPKQLTIQDCQVILKQVPPKAPFSFCGTEMTAETLGHHVEQVTARKPNAAIANDVAVEWKDALGNMYTGTFAEYTVRSLLAGS